ncbi:MAG: hypothetical protein KF809_09470 [Chloroflexi bacterium]|nr:hypothetical protein [Chloroflexota bacterium]
MDGPRRDAMQPNESAAAVPVMVVVGVADRDDVVDVIAATARAADVWVAILPDEASGGWLVAELVTDGPDLVLGGGPTTRLEALMEVLHRSLPEAGVADPMLRIEWRDPGSLEP